MNNKIHNTRRRFSSIICIKIKSSRISLSFSGQTDTVVNDRIRSHVIRQNTVVYGVRNVRPGLRESECKLEIYARLIHLFFFSI
jgi:hypothetical protein